MTSTTAGQQIEIREERREKKKTEREREREKKKEERKKEREQYHTPAARSGRWFL